MARRLQLQFMLGYTLMIVGALIALALIAIFLLSGHSGTHRKKPRLDEQKGTSLTEPLAEEPETQRTGHDRI